MKRRVYGLDEEGKGAMVTSHRRNNMFHLGIIPEISEKSPRRGLYSQRWWI